VKVVPRERVSVRKTLVTEQRSVTAPVRAEQVELVEEGHA
jgi:stress response protein YsnF